MEGPINTAEELGRKLANPITIATGMVSRAMEELRGTGDIPAALQSLETAFIALTKVCTLLNQGEDSKADIRGKRILIVDDEPQIREILRYAFERHGAQIHEACDGNSAYAACERTPMDLVVTDLRMPEGDGIELLNRMRSGPLAQTPTVVVTGLTDLNVAQAYSRGADIVFSKPFQPKAVVDAARRLLEREARKRADTTE